MNKLPECAPAPLHKCSFVELGGLLRLVGKDSEEGFVLCTVVVGSSRRGGASTGHKTSIHRAHIKLSGGMGWDGMGRGSPCSVAHVDVRKHPTPPPRMATTTTLYTTLPFAGFNVLCHPGSPSILHIGERADSFSSVVGAPYHPCTHSIIPVLCSSIYCSTKMPFLSYSTVLQVLQSHVAQPHILFE